MPDARSQPATMSRRMFSRRTTTGLTLGSLGAPLLLQACAPATPAARPPSAPTAATGATAAAPAIVALTYAPPPPADQNAAWQAVNKYLNVNLKLQMVPSADYPSAVNVALAGADLPDFIYNPTTTQPLGVISGLPQFARSRCADLTPFLSGDAIREFPNLANFSTYTWRSGV